MSGKINVLFYPKKRESDTDGKVTVYARINVNGKRAEGKPAPSFPHDGC